MTRIFVDASALVPMEIARDQWHGRLQQVLAVLTKSGEFTFATANWTLYEALALVRRYGAARARHLYGMVSTTFVVVPVLPPVEAEALRRFLDWADKGASVVDHANLLTALDTGCEAVLSFDDDFAPLARAAGIRLVR